MDQHLHPFAPRDVPHQALEDCLVNLCQDYRNPGRPRFDTAPLINAYNATLANPLDAFSIGVQECAMEYLSCPGLRGNGLLNNLLLQDGFLTTFVERGVCWGCLEPQESVSLILSLHFPHFNFQAYHEPILHLLLAQGNNPVDLRRLLQPALTTPVHRTLICQQPTPFCGTRLLPSSLRALHGQVLIVSLTRHDGFGDNIIITTPVQEPQDGDQAFQGRRLVAVLVSKPRHWVTFAKIDNVWWNLDSATNAAVMQNPFVCQSQNNLIMQLWFAT